MLLRNSRRTSVYSQQELDDAVAAGVISAANADALRAYIESQRSTVIPDEEQFRLITGFNDIFVSIAAAILLFAVGWIGQSIGQATGIVIADGDRFGPSFLAPLAVAATSWALALFFTAKRRMALPSILLLLSFVGGVLASTAFLLVQIIGPDRINDHNQAVTAMVGGVAAAVAAAAAWLHWRRFHVPITIAAGAAAVAGLFLAIVIGILQPGDSASAKNIVLGFVLLLGIGVFLFAMWWDSSDRARITRRSDVAFWLHLLAAPMIAHPIFTLMGLNNGVVSTGEALGVVGLYVLFGLTALAVDRRALLVSALAYVLYALTELFKQFGAVELNVALTALIIGSALLLLSAYWHQARRLVVTRLPSNLQARLPNLDRTVVITQQAA
jgi:MFS family permease